jgi:hypothetical protein
MISKRQRAIAEEFHRPNRRGTDMTAAPSVKDIERQIAQAEVAGKPAESARLHNLAAEARKAQKRKALGDNLRQEVATARLTRLQWENETAALADLDLCGAAAIEAAKEIDAAPSKLKEAFDIIQKDLSETEARAHVVVPRPQFYDAQSALSDIRASLLNQIALAGLDHRDAGDANFRSVAAAVDLRVQQLRNEARIEFEKRWPVPPPVVDDLGEIIG